MLQQTISRRRFLSASCATGATALLSSRLFAEEQEKLQPTADTLVLLWMAGGQASTETWDPKKYTPFERGMEAKAVYSTFRAIPTSVDGLHISEGLPNIAKVMHLGTLVRTFKPGNLGFIFPSPHPYHSHSVYV